MIDVFVIFAITACVTAPTEPVAARWPKPGVQVVVEARAQVDDAGRARAWSAEAWTEAEAGADTPGCHAVGARTAVGLAAVDVGAPAPVRLQPQDGRLAAAGPLLAEDARWQVGDVAVLRDDGVHVVFESALRFPDAPDLGELALRDDGGAWLRWTPRPGEHIEVEAENAAGVRVVCRGAEGRVFVPWTAYDPAHPTVTVRAVQASHVGVVNTVQVWARAAVEATFSFAHAARWTERILPSPQLAPPSPGPRRAPRGRVSRG